MVLSFNSANEPSAQAVILVINNAATEEEPVRISAEGNFLTANAMCSFRPACHVLWCPH